MHAKTAARFYRNLFYPMPKSFPIQIAVSLFNTADDVTGSKIILRTGKSTWDDVTTGCHLRVCPVGHTLKYGPNHICYFSFAVGHFTSLMKPVLHQLKLSLTL
ncbi:uncharacterized protein [Penaeus vannamei]|uniref:uncharacterized protein n=1 Tax=Penaeus vannamei TaxID=6689 RepID=UPI00387F9485